MPAFKKLAALHCFKKSIRNTATTFAGASGQLHAKPLPKQLFEIKN
jgi:hypothetical protein